MCVFVDATSQNTPVRYGAGMHADINSFTTQENMTGSGYSHVAFGDCPLVIRCKKDKKNESPQYDSINASGFSRSIRYQAEHASSNAMYPPRSSLSIYSVETSTKQESPGLKTNCPSLSLDRWRGYTYPLLSLHPPKAARCYKSRHPLALLRNKN